MDRQVIVVDDVAAVGDSLRALLQAYGFNVNGYLSAEEFLATEDLTDVGCLLVDVRLQGMSGLELQQKLQGRGCEIPVIFMSGHGDHQLREQARASGAAAFLTKPISAQELIAQVGQALLQSGAKA